MLDRAGRSPAAPPKELKMANTLPTPFAAIARLADHVLLSKHEQEDFAECEKRLGPIGNAGHIRHAAFEVQTWLDVQLMTVWSQEMLDELER
jgi:hypothetical protein